MSINNNLNVYSQDLSSSKDPVRDLLRIVIGDLNTNNYTVDSISTNPLDPRRPTFKISAVISSQDENVLINLPEDINKFFLDATLQLQQRENTIIQYIAPKSNDGNVEFNFNFYNEDYENAISQQNAINGIPSIYASSGVQGCKNFINSIISNGQFPAISVEQITFLNSKQTIQIDNKNSEFSLSQTDFPYYNLIFIPNIETKKTLFSDFLKIPDFEKQLSENLQNTSSQIFYKNANENVVTVDNKLLSSSSYNQSEYKTSFANYTKKYLYSTEYKIGDIFKLEKSQTYEIVGYRINKYYKNNNTPIQSYYLSNIFGQEVQTENGKRNIAIEKKNIKFIDNQIKFGDSYRYEIKAVLAVNSFNYRYEKIEKIYDTTSSQPPTTAKYEIKVLIEPIIKILELPYFTKNVDCAVIPQNPEVQIYTKVSNDKEVLFTLNVYPDIQKPIIIKNEDEAIFDSYPKIRRGLERTPQYVKFFENDITSYEVYRIEEQKPTSFTDFSDKLYKTINLEKLKVTNFIDIIKPNTKYYYTFRCNFRGNISNPSDIFEVELVNSDGGIYPVIKVLPKTDILVETNAEKILKDSSKNFKRYFSIYPNPLHLGINDNRLDGDAIPNPIVNNPSQTIIKNINTVNTSQVWAKRFKIRITSTSTGRKIDLNMVFDKKDKKNE